MNNPFSLEQISKTGNLDANLFFSQHKLDLMTRFMEIKSIKPKMKWKERARDLSYSSSALQRYGQDQKMQSHYKSTNSKKVNWSQMTSNDLKWPQKSLWLILLNLIGEKIGKVAIPMIFIILQDLVEQSFSAT